MTDSNIIPFTKPATAQAAEPITVATGDKGQVINLSTPDVGGLEIPQPDGTTKTILFSADMMDWWYIIAVRMWARCPEGMVDRIFINTDRGLHEQGAWFDQKRTLSIRINRNQLVQIAEALPFILTSTFNGQMDDDLYMQLSALTAEHRVEDDIPEYKEALIIHPTLDPEEFCLIWVEC